jgi:hypothetical protein
VSTSLSSNKADGLGRWSSSKTLACRPVQSTVSDFVSATQGPRSHQVSLGSVPPKHRSCPKRPGRSRTYLMGHSRWPFLIQLGWFSASGNEGSRFWNRPTQYVYVCIIVLSMSFRNFQNLSRVLQVIAPLHPSPFYYPTFSNHAPLQIPKRPWVLPLGKTWCLCTMPWAQLPWPWPWAPVGCAAAAAWPWAPWAGWVRCGRSWGHRPLISSSPWESLWHGYYNVCIYMCNCVTYILVGG